jgi:hypothetical protein
MFLVYWNIRTIESGSSHFQSQPGRLQRRFAVQAFLYHVGATFIGRSLVLILRNTFKHHHSLWVTDEMKRFTPPSTMAKLRLQYQTELALRCLKHDDNPNTESR